MNSENERKRERNARSKRMLDARSNVAAEKSSGESEVREENNRRDNQREGGSQPARELSRRRCGCSCSCSGAQRPFLTHIARDAGEWVFERQKSESRDA